MYQDARIYPLLFAQTPTYTNTPIFNLGRNNNSSDEDEDTPVSTDEDEDANKGEIKEIDDSDNEKIASIGQALLLALRDVGDQPEKMKRVAHFISIFHDNIAPGKPFNANYHVWDILTRCKVVAVAYNRGMSIDTLPASHEELLALKYCHPRGHVNRRVAKLLADMNLSWLLESQACIFTWNFETGTRGYEISTRSAEQLKQMSLKAVAEGRSVAPQKTEERRTAVDAGIQTSQRTEVPQRAANGPYGRARLESEIEALKSQVASLSFEVRRNQKVQQHFKYVTKLTAEMTHAKLQAFVKSEVKAAIAKQSEEFQLSMSKVQNDMRKLAKEKAPVFFEGVEAVKEDIGCFESPMNNSYFALQGRIVDESVATKEEIKVSMTEQSAELRKLVQAELGAVKSEITAAIIKELGDLKISMSKQHVDLTKLVQDGFATTKCEAKANMGKHSMESLKYFKNKSVWPAPDDYYPANIETWHSYSTRPFIIPPQVQPAPSMGQPSPTNPFSANLDSPVSAYSVEQKHKIDGFGQGDPPISKQTTKSSSMSPILTFPPLVNNTRNRFGLETKKGQPKPAQGFVPRSGTFGTMMDWNDE
ncbi:hypothetical protein N0V88_004859 [Collariella sp. IMI 366227]|nr:hypothetical protein N0V88_004859 [Collariella sp. IMI 366227]